MTPEAIAALAVARKEKRDLIIFHLGLPGGDGFAVMQRLKANVDLTLIPVIVVSARDPPFNEPRAIEAGAEAFLLKPVDNEDFLAAVDNALLCRAHAQR